ncbi:MAG: hypothetical protein ABI456_16695, partial [Ktedonobacteraceae bacterium]
MRLRVGGVHLCFSILLAIFLLSDALTGWASLIPPAHAAALTPFSSPQASMTFQQFLKEGRPAPKVTPSAPRTSPPASILSKGKGPALSQLPPHAEPATMHPLTFSLTPSFQAGSVSVKPLDMVGSDQRLEVQIRPGLLDLSQATVATGGAPTGTLTLHVTQIHGHFVGSTSVLGTYTLQLDDAQGHVVTGARLRTPITFLYHYQLSEMQRMDLDPGRLFLTWPSEVSAARQAHQPTAAFIIPLHNDPATHTLTAQSTVLGPQFDVGGGDTTEQSPPTPHLASVQGNAGQLSYSYPLTVAPGPPGTTPALTLTYNSGSTNARTGVSSPSNDVGDGWSLTLGSISAAQYPSGSAQTGTWYALNDVDNTSDRLVPNGSPGAFVTEHLTALKVQQIQENGQPCFHVWAGDGAYSEYGCTTDSLQYHTDSNGTRTNYRWDLDSLVPPNEGSADRYLRVSYEQDIVTISGHVTIRDAVMKQITYGVQGGSVAGTVDFTYLAPFTNGTWTTAYRYGSNYHCTPLVSTPLRCDDPLDYPGGLTAPTVMSTFSLQTVTSYVGDDSSATRKAASYSFSYNESSFLHGWDDYTQIQEYMSGTHQLTSVVPTMYLGGTAHPLKPLQLGYSSALMDSYSDQSEKILNGTQNYSVQIYGQYLTSYVDTNTGVGATI